MLHRALPSTADVDPDVDPDSPGSRETLLAWYAVEAQQHLRLNLVTSLDGRATGPGETSDTLTTRTDRMLLGVIRQVSDAVLVGAATVRAESLQRPRRTPLVVLTGSGDLTGHGFTHSTSAEGASRGRILVVTAPSGAPRVAESLRDTQHETIVVHGENERLDLRRVLEALRERGLHRVVAEGGPELAAQLLDAGLVDELCLTMVPSIAGTGIPLVDGARSTRVTPTQILVETDGVLYGRWAITRDR